MALVVETIYTGGIAQLSYLVGDDSAGRAAVIDPRPDCEVYLQLAQAKGMAIEAIFETHIHADFLSGSRELSRRLRGAPIHASAVDAEKYGFDFWPVVDGDRFSLGELALTARHTPGHTPEHMSYLATQEGAEGPFAVFSGDALFVDSVGRPDLLGDEQAAALAAKLFRTLRDFYIELDEGVIVYPGHGSGSACGPDIGDRMISTIGYEKASNRYLQMEDEGEFVEAVLRSAPPEPRHYRPLKQVNVEGPRIFNGLPPVEPLSASDFEAKTKKNGACVLDTREMLAFGSAHIAESLNIAAQPELSVWAGWLLAFDAPLYLVLEDDTRLEHALRLLWRTGHTNARGYLAGGMPAWIQSGFDVERVEQIDARRLSGRLGTFQTLDVRSPEEREQGYIPASQHCSLPEVEEKALDMLDTEQPVAAYCASGFRASIATSILKRIGFQKVYNVPGSFGAWKAAGLEVEAGAKAPVSVQ